MENAIGWLDFNLNPIGDLYLMESLLSRLVIIGAGGFGRELYSWARMSLQIGKEWKVHGFIDDNPTALDEYSRLPPLLGSIEDFQPRDEDVFICAIGDPVEKRRCSEIISKRGGRFTQLVHKTATIGHDVNLAAGVILCPNTVVSTNITIGCGVAVNSHSSIGHDVTIGDWSQINCHCDITASVKVGEEVFMGSRVSVAPKVSIGDRAFLGIGSVVWRDVLTDWKVVGVPARRIG